MIQTSARLLRLLTLLQMRRDWSGTALAERLEIDVRTVRRDIDRLRELGYRIDASSGVGGGYRLGAGPNLPPVLLSDDEAVAVAVALRAASGSVAGLEGAGASLLAKLDQLLPVRLQPRVRSLESVLHSLPTGALLADIDTLATVAGACRDRRRLRLDYRDRQGRNSQRHIEPLQVVHTGRRWYLVAWDLGREDWRTFRMDRIEAPVPDGTLFIPRQLPEDPASFVSRALASAPARYVLQLRLEGDHAELSTRIPSWCGLLEPAGEQCCTLRIGTDSLTGMAATLVFVCVPYTCIDAPDWLPELDVILARTRAGLDARVDS